MSDASLAMGTPVEIDIPGVNVLLYPVTLQILGTIREQMVRKRKECIPKPAEFISALDSADVNDPDVLKVAIAEIMAKSAELNLEACNIGFEEITGGFGDPMNLYDIFLLCMRSKDGKSVLPIQASNVCMYLGRSGNVVTSDPKCDILRWMVLSGLLDEPDPTKSGTGS